MRGSRLLILLMVIISISVDVAQAAQEAYMHYGEATVDLFSIKHSDERGSSQQSTTMGASFQFGIPFISFGMDFVSDGMSSFFAPMYICKLPFELKRDHYLNVYGGIGWAVGYGILKDKGDDVKYLSAQSRVLECGITLCIRKFAIGFKLRTLDTFNETMYGISIGTAISGEIL
ncbi:hypothetical protein RsTz2092_13040 [Deferribacterales bacterium RsTz2092]|nr:hypothetical protein AGMMS49941_13100 [Deferribacterales bacterium]